MRHPVQRLWILAGKLARMHSRWTGLLRGRIIQGHLDLALNNSKNLKNANELLESFRYMEDNEKVIKDIYSKNLNEYISKCNELPNIVNHLTEKRD